MPAKRQEQVEGVAAWKMSAGHQLARLIRAKLEQDGTLYLDALRDIALNETVEPRVRIVALIHLLDRQIGKAPETIQIDHKQDIRAMVANITPEIQAKLTDVITALRAARSASG